MAHARATNAHRGDDGEATGWDRDVDALLARIDRDLPALARELIPRAPTATETFLSAPDHPDEHKPEWHEFGIITHTRRFVAALRKDVPHALRRIDPAIAARVERHLDGTIDGMARRDLLAIAGYWHDIGKYTSRTAGRRGWRFIGHAHDSARIIRGPGPHGEEGLGARYGLTPAQTDYVARLADLHYEPMELKLALERQRDTADGDDVYREIARRLGDVGYEVSSLFWADTVAKGATPRQVAQRPALRKVLVQTLRAVDERLAPATDRAADTAEEGAINGDGGR